MFDLAPIATLLFAAVALAAGGRLARRAGVPSSAGMGLAFAALAAAVALAPTSFRRWAAGGDAGEYVLSAARSAGVAGLLAVAGLRFDFDKAFVMRAVAWRVAGAGAALFAATATLLVTVGGQQAGVALAAAAAVAATSPWLAGELEGGGKGDAAASASGPAAMLAVAALLAVHFTTVFAVLPGGGRASVYVVVAAYEVVKAAVFFGFGYFVTTRFLARAAGRVSAARVTVGYVAISVLLFVLAASALGQLAAFLWAFVAGAVWNGGGAGKVVASKERPTASALLVAFALLPVLLQTHGRSVSNWPLLVSAVLIILIVKFLLGWAGARAGGAAGGGARRLAAASLAPVELAPATLGAAVSTWAVGGEVYFGVVVFTVLSMVAGPLAARFAGVRVEAGEVGAQSNPQPVRKGKVAGRAKASSPGRGARSAKKMARAAALVLLLLAFHGVGNVRAQEAQSEAGEADPVERAMRRIEAAVDERAAAAERVKAGAKVLDEAVAARKKGNKGEADELLKEAERLAAADQQAERSALIDELYRSIAAERDALNPKAAPVTTATGAGLTAGFALAAVPPGAVAAVNSYRSTLGRILEQERVPVELLAVAYVESRFRTGAVSPKGAGGIWQFMPGTATRYGLQVTAQVDHRTHPDHSTRAAARYLRDLYRMFGDWKLALAGYNWGEGNVQKAIRRAGTRDFDELARRGYIPLETRKYVPAVLALAARVGGGPSPLARRTGE
jgi:soluble lytic murein transglycosylase-like protein